MHLSRLADADTDPRIVLTLTCGQGADLLKHGRAGRPKVHFFRLADADGQLAWRSSRGHLRCIRLAAVQRVRSAARSPALALRKRSRAGSAGLDQGPRCLLRRHERGRPGGNARPTRRPHWSVTALSHVPPRLCAFNDREDSAVPSWLQASGSQIRTGSAILGHVLHGRIADASRRHAQTGASGAVVLAGVRGFSAQGLTNSAVMAQVLHGQVTETFRRHALLALAALSFSLVHAGSGSRASLIPHLN